MGENITLALIGNPLSPHLQRWIRFYSEKGVHVVLFTRYDPTYLYEQSDRIFKGVEIAQVKFHGNKFTRSMNLKKDLRKKMGEYKPDILHAHYVALYGWWGYLTGFHPFVMQVWGTDVFKFPTTSMKNYFTVKKILKSADTIIVTNEYTKKYVYKKFNLKNRNIVINRWGVDLTIFDLPSPEKKRQLRNKWGIPSDNIVFCSPRHLTKLYQVDLLTEGFHQFTKENPDLKVYFLILTGLSRDNEIYNKVVEKIKISKNISLIEKELNAYEMAEIFQISDAVFSIPIHDQFSSSIQEAMACGSIPIVSKLPVYGEFLEDEKNALFLKEVNAQEIKKSIKRFLNIDENKKAEMIKYNRNIIEKYFNWEKESEKMLDLYKKCLENTLY